MTHAFSFHSILNCIIELLCINKQLKDKSRNREDPFPPPSIFDIFLCTPLLYSAGKWDLGMHKWEYTPTYRGFDTFYGYYDAGEDYYTHIAGGMYREPNRLRPIRVQGVDFRSNKDPLTSENGSYSTHLFTKAIQDAIESHDEDKKPFFVYGAYQAVHSPLEVPDQYLDKCSSIPYPNRKIFCGMARALDEGIANVTATLEAKGYLNNTVIIFSTDNGGQTAEGSSNWPLRGNKATLFEGGVRGVSFVWGKMLSKSNFDNTGMMHITDWYRTIVEGIAGIPLDDSVTKNLDGYNLWSTITQNDPSPRSEILHQLDPPFYGNPKAPFVGQAAFRSGDWKLITGQPTCNPDMNFDKCPAGWVHLNGTIEQPPGGTSSQGTWLFNITADPYERKDVSASFPDVVTQLMQRIEAYNATHIEQFRLPFDPKSDPANFGGVWTPWLD